MAAHLHHITLYHLPVTLHHITRDSTNLTYMIQCKRCKKTMIGRGETKCTLHEWFKDHRQATNNLLHANTTAAVPSHFTQPGHSFTDTELIPLALQPTLSMSRHKAREGYLIHVYRGKTLSPDGLNRRNEH